jgi:Flp pilus assembly protein CpaB
MVGFSLLFAALALRADPATPVLMVARPVPAGATISDADLSVVRMVPEAGMRVFTEADRSSVVGHTAAVPLVAGSVLSPAQVGAPDWPPTGESVVAVAFSAGQVPAGVVAGSHVSVLLPVSDTADEPRASAVVSATVVEVALPDVSGSVVVSLLARAGDARLVAAAGGEVSMLLENPAGGR